MTRLQSSASPEDTAHLRAGDRITLEEFATELGAAAVWLRQLAVAGERPQVPVNLEAMLERLDSMARELTGFAEEVAETNAIIEEGRPLMRSFGSEPWGAAAYGADPDRSQYGKRLSTVLSDRQIRALARPDSPWAADHAEPGISYLDGLDGLPELHRWESPRAVKRRAREREERIQAETGRQPCPTCGAEPDRECRTKTKRVAQTPHEKRRAAAVAVVDAA